MAKTTKTTWQRCYRVIAEGTAGDHSGAVARAGGARQRHAERRAIVTNTKGT